VLWVCERGSMYDPISARSLNLAFVFFLVAAVGEYLLFSSCVDFCCVVVASLNRVL